MSETNNNPSILSHVSLGTNMFDTAVLFYDTVLSSLGYKRVEEFPGAVAYLSMANRLQLVMACTLALLLTPKN